jgi:polar amino acid transport system substrate-binding protein
MRIQAGWSFRKGQGSFPVNDEWTTARKELAPSGRIRAAINRANTVLVQVDPVTGIASGVTIDLARALAARLDVPVDLIEFDRAGKVFEALGNSQWDIAFLAIDLARVKNIEFTPPYVIIEGTYAVPENSSITSVTEVDRPGNSIAVVQGSAYDLFLTRTLKSASILRVDSGEAAFDSGAAGTTAVAGVKQALLALMKKRSGFRMLEPPFMEIRQAMGTPKGRPAAAAYLTKFIEEMKASGFVADALKRAGQGSATIAPPAKD